MIPKEIIDSIQFTVRPIKEHSTSIYVDPNLVYVGTSLGRIYTYSLDNGELIDTFEGDVRAPILDLNVGANNTYLYLCNSRLYENKSKLTKLFYKGLMCYGEDILAVTRDNNAILIGNKELLLPAEVAKLYDDKIFCLYDNNITVYNRDGDPEFSLDVNSDNITDFSVINGMAKILEPGKGVKFIGEKDSLPAIGLNENIVITTNSVYTTGGYDYIKYYHPNIVTATGYYDKHLVIGLVNGTIKVIKYSSEVVWQDTVQKLTRTYFHLDKCTLEA